MTQKNVAQNLSIALVCNHYSSPHSVNIEENLMFFCPVASILIRSFNATPRNKVSRGSSVSIVSGYGLDDRAIEVRSPAEA
jgi:hypothetical protein